ncbi:hypothetical protein B9Z55_017484 [Caenorhabditis nigoni]|uniref:Uncharacterized protein n=1 Tax=Caenorhabditis nigoni TaxID=1611254 RepID=A0A2G5T9M7_9PELO|nr:hypothetical protein B9Z55_017484 [Caenorhabditis nigoni]
MAHRDKNRPGFFAYKEREKQLESSVPEAVSRSSGSRGTGNGTGAIGFKCFDPDAGVGAVGLGAGGGGIGAGEGGIRNGEGGI